MSVSIRFSAGNRWFNQRVNWRECNEGLFTEVLAGMGNQQGVVKCPGTSHWHPIPSRDLLVRVMATVGRGNAQQEM